MLTIRNLEKHYRSKKRQDHHALENINLEFGDKGFVFILGELDNFDSGDIVIKGKSSKYFKANDWDSYRNTYVGFVFQDFNIMENYSVAKNIGLALELQGVDKKDITKEIDRILKSVDMEGYAKRKPNELSGGQLQIRNSIRMAFSSIWRKKLKMIFSILLFEKLSLSSI